MRCALNSLVCLALLFSALSGLPVKTAARVIANPLPISAPSLEEQVFQAINQVRAENGLPQFKRKSDLNAVARLHSQDMAERDYFSHVSPNGDNLQKRITRGGIFNWSRVAENLACNFGHENPVNIAVTGWMNSPGHRHNILDKNLTETGIGVAVDAKGKIYLTQLFAQR